MTRPIIKFITKVSILSLIILVIINLTSCITQTWEETETSTGINQENKENFVKVENKIMASAWVAITTNIWYKLNNDLKMSASIFNEVLSIEEIYGNEKRAMNNLISQNMLYTREYLNILKTDIKWELDKSRNRTSFLNTFISWLEIRYKNASTNKENLIAQRDIFESSLINSQSSIDNLKVKISSDFSKSDYEQTMKNIEDYLSLRKSYTYSRTYIIYINQFIKQYDFLNAYNKLLLDTLINNKDALIKDSYVVLPDSWSELVDKLNLLYTEEDFKSLNEENNK